MNICILTNNENIDVVRQRAKQIPQFSKHTALAIPLSSDGNVPVTHWFCTFNASEEVLAQINDLREFSEVFESGPKEVLRDRSLKVVKMKKIHEEREKNEVRNEE